MAMPRADRRLAAGGIHHVHNRGALRRVLFADEFDWRLFMGTLREARDRHEVELLAWCLMPNHWHLLVRSATAAALPAFMRWLTLAHSRRWQAMHGQNGIGTLYQGRYRSHAVLDDAHRLTAARYIERNPVRSSERLGGPGGLLAPLPVPGPDDWSAWLDRAAIPAGLDTRRGRTVVKAVRRA